MSQLASGELNCVPAPRSAGENCFAVSGRRAGSLQFAGGIVPRRYPRFKSSCSGLLARPAKIDGRGAPLVVIALAKYGLAGHDMTRRGSDRRHPVYYYFRSLQFAV